MMSFVITALYLVGDAPPVKLDTPTSYQNGTVCERAKARIGEKRVQANKKLCQEKFDRMLLRNLGPSDDQMQNVKDRLKISKHILKRLYDKDCGSRNGYHRLT